MFFRVLFFSGGCLWLGGREDLRGECLGVGGRRWVYGGDVCEKKLGWGEGGFLRQTRAGGGCSWGEVRRGEVYSSWKGMGRAMYTCASTASSLNMRWANARRPLSHGCYVGGFGV
jgi:hypothetical protein